MKKLITILSIFTIFYACDKIEDLNENTKDPSSVSGESLFTYGQKKLVDQVVSTNVNLNISRLLAQYWTETTYPQESQYDLVNRSIPDNHWDVLYRDVLKSFKEASSVLKATPLGAEKQEVRNNKLAIIEIMEIYTYSILVETFGDIPYTDAIDITKPTPKYDDGLTIYKDLVTRLNAAILSMDGTQISFGKADNIYSGATAQWLKFANSLKLRFGMVLADVDNGLAKATIEAAAPNVFTANADNAKLHYLSAVPNTNPLYVDLVASGRDDFVPANTLVDTMNYLNDPRRALFFTQIGGAYVGGKYGFSNDYSLFSHLVDKIKDPSFPAAILDYSEVEFLLAEAVARGFSVTGTVESHYNKAIEASILDWGGSSVDVTGYLANPNVAYATAKGNYKQKIGTQKWIALYNRGLDAWTEFRRLDWPKLKAPSSAKSVFPMRYTYPIEEQTLNGENYKAASAAIGGDNVGTKLFWDKN